jgi:hypothetical protein
MEIGTALDDRSIGRRLSRLAAEISGLEDERRRFIDQYAVNQITVEAYIAANRDLDRQQEQLTRKKAELISAMRSPQEDFVDASIRQFCATGNARLRTCTDFDTKRQFLKDHIERVIFNGYRITMLGSVPVRSIAGETTLQFRIEGEISKMQVRANAARMTMEKQGRLPRPAHPDTLSPSNPL